MKKRTAIALGGLVALMALVVPACSLLDDDDSGSSSGATLSVYGTDAPGDVTSLNVELVGMRIYMDSSDVEGTALPPEGADNVVDLVAAANSGTPGKFGDFVIPEGSYQCAEGTLNLVDFEVEGEDGLPVLCESATNLPGTISTSRLCLPGDLAVVVGEGGQVDLVFDIPVLRGTYDPDTGCTLELDLRGRRLMRLADM